MHWQAQTSCPTEHPDRTRWNEKYLARGPEAFGLGPADWLLAHKALLGEQSKGRALDVACGNGRNSIFLAETGFTVDAIDISDVVIDWLKKEVRTRKLSIHPECADLEGEPIPKQMYQVVVNIKYLQRSLFPRLKEALVPGGLLLLETFTTDDIEVVGRTLKRAFRLEPNELLHTFRDMRIIDYREEIVTESSRGRAVARMVARKPAGESK